MEEKKEMSAEEYQLQVLEAQYIEDLRVKNRTIAQLRTQVQMLTQRLQQYEADSGTESDEAGPQNENEGPQGARPVPASD